MTHWTVILFIVASVGCQAPLAFLPKAEHSQADEEETIDIGTVTQPTLHELGVLNATSQHYGLIFRHKGGSCYVRIPSKTPGPPGSIGRTHALPCPASMHHPSFTQCGFGRMTRTDTQTCQCDPWEGDPPPNAFILPCPDRPTERE